MKTETVNSYIHPSVHERIESLFTQVAKLQESIDEISRERDSMRDSLNIIRSFCAHGAPYEELADWIGQNL